MLTVKLQYGHVTKIVEASSVDVYPSGPRAKMADEPNERTNEIIELSVGHSDRQNEVFYIGLKSKDSWWGKEQNYWLYDRAYIENQAGKTIEVIQPFNSI